MKNGLSYHLLKRRIVISQDFLAREKSKKNGQPTFQLLKTSIRRHFNVVWNLNYLVRYIWFLFFCVRQYQYTATTAHEKIFWKYANPLITAAANLIYSSIINNAPSCLSFIRKQTTRTDKLGLLDKSDENQTFLTP